MLQDTDFELHERQVDGAHVIAVSGELDIATSPRLRDALAGAIRAGHEHVVIDLAQVRFVDSMGLAALLNALRRLTRAGARLSVVVEHPDVLRTFRLTRLDTTFALFPSLEAALAGENRIS